MTSFFSRTNDIMTQPFDLAKSSNLALVLQANTDIATPILKKIARLSQSQHIQSVMQANGRPAFCLTGGQRDHESASIAALCAEHQIDAAWVSQHWQRKDIGLVVMDMDSTLITIECIDEIADMQGLKAQVSVSTEAAMRGELDFSDSLRARVALLAGLPEAALERVYSERLRLSQGAETLLSALHGVGAKSLLVSGGFTFFTEKLKARLGLTWTHANQLEVCDGKLTGKVLGDIVDAQAKADYLVHYREQLGLRPDQVLALGDGANDLYMLAAAGMGVAFHAKPVVQAQTAFSLNYVGLDGVLAWLA